MDNFILSLTTLRVLFLGNLRKGDCAMIRCFGELLVATMVSWVALWMDHVPSLQKVEETELKDVVGYACYTAATDITICAKAQNVKCQGTQVIVNGKTVTQYYNLAYTGQARGYCAQAIGAGVSQCTTNTPMLCCTSTYYSDKDCTKKISQATSEVDTNVSLAGPPCGGG